MIYFDNAATSRFKPKCMIDSMVDVLNNSSNPGRGGHTDSIELASRIYGVRNYIKSIFSANDNYRVIFTKNTTEALNIAILGYLNGFNYKVHVITSMLEHNSVLRPLKHLAKLGKIEVTLLPIKDGTIDVSTIEYYIKNNTRLIALNHMSNVLGTCTDIGLASEISIAYNIPLLVDGAQSIGHVRLSLSKTPVSMLAVAGHKGLHGPEGSGFLLIDTSKVSLYPLMYGGTGTNSNLLDMDTEYPESFEVGTLNVPNIIGMYESMRWTYDNFDAIDKCVTKYNNIIYNYLTYKSNIEVYSPKNAYVLTFNVNGYTSEDIAEHLDENNIAVRAGLHCAPLVHSHFGTLNRGMVRVSVDYNNTIGDIDLLTIALDKVPIL